MEKLQKHLNLHVGELLISSSFLNDIWISDQNSPVHAYSDAQLPATDTLKNFIIGL